MTAAESAPGYMESGWWRRRRLDLLLAFWIAVTSLVFAGWLLTEAIRWALKVVGW